MASNGKIEIARPLRLAIPILYLIAASISFFMYRKFFFFHLVMESAAAWGLWKLEERLDNYLTNRVCPVLLWHFLHFCWIVRQ